MVSISTTSPSQNVLWRLPLAGGEESQILPDRGTVGVRLCSWEAGDLFHKGHGPGRRTGAGVFALCDSTNFVGRYYSSVGDWGWRFHRMSG